MLCKEPILDKKTGYVSLLVLITFFFPLTYVHELGHVLSCVVDGYSYTIQINIVTATVTCDGTPSNLMFYWASGGLFAMLVALSPLIAWKWAKRNKGVVIGCFTIATGHGVNAMIETLAHIWYVTNIAFASTTLVAIPTVVVFAIFLVILGKIKKLRT